MVIEGDITPRPDNMYTYNVPAKNQEQANANGWLICAAPDLLKACKEAIRQLRQYGADHEDYEEISAAIKKAEGKL